MANILITGGLGFVGTQMAHYFIGKGHRVTLVDHSPSPKPYTPRKAVYVCGDTTEQGKWQEALRDQDVVINLAGVSIFQRWTEGVKIRIYNSRIKTTQNVVDALAEGSTLLSTSAIGYYGDAGEKELTENSPPGKDFLSKVCLDWEKAAWKGEARKARVVLCRFGIVLGKEGGALGQMLKAFRFGLGGPLGSGKQWFSWISMVDLLRAAEFVMMNPAIRGAVNFCAPQPVRNKELARTIGKILGKPAFFKTPSFVIKSALGEFGSVLLGSQKVVPEKLRLYGFDFKHPDLEEALQSLLRRPI